MYTNAFLYSSEYQFSYGYKSLLSLISYLTYSMFLTFGNLTELFESWITSGRVTRAVNHSSAAGIGVSCVRVRPRLILHTHGPLQNLRLVDRRFQLRSTSHHPSRFACGHRCHLCALRAEGISWEVEMNIYFISVGVRFMFIVKLSIQICLVDWGS